MHSPRYSAFFVLLALCSPTGSSFAQELEGALIDSLRQLRMNWNGTACEFTTIYKREDAPDTSRQNTFEFDSNGIVIRVNTRLERKISAGRIKEDNWMYMNDNFVFGKNFKLYLDKDFSKENIWAAVPNSSQPNLLDRTYSQLGLFFTWDRPSALHWYEILKDKDIQITVVDGGSETRLIAEQAKLGRFEFLFRRLPTGFRLAAVKREYSNPKLKADGLLKCEYRVQAMDYVEFTEELSLPSKIETKYKATWIRNGRKEVTNSNLVQSLVEINKLEDDLPRRIEFPGIEIKDGTPVRVIGAKGKSFEVQNGLVVPVQDAP